MLSIALVEVRNKSNISLRLLQNVLNMTAIVPIPCGAYLVESRKRPLEETADFIEVKREKSDMEGKFTIDFISDWSSRDFARYL